MLRRGEYSPGFLRLITGGAQCRAQNSILRNTAIYTCAQWLTKAITKPVDTSQTKWESQKCWAVPHRRLALSSVPTPLTPSVRYGWAKQYHLDRSIAHVRTMPLYIQEDLFSFNLSLVILGWPTSQKNTKTEAITTAKGPLKQCISMAHNRQRIV